MWEEERGSKELRLNKKRKVSTGGRGRQAEKKTPSSKRPGNVSKPQTSSQDLQKSLLLSTSVCDIFSRTPSPRLWSSAADGRHATPGHGGAPVLRGAV